MDIKQLAKNICKIKPHYFVKIDFKGTKGYVNGFNEIVNEFEAAYLTPNKMLIEAVRQRFINKYYWFQSTKGMKTIERHIKICKIERQVQNV